MKLKKAASAAFFFCITANYNEVARIKCTDAKINVRNSIYFQVF